jgi:hypothetical protein
MKKYFYVYYSYEEYGRGYIGKRECKCFPQEDINYFGSFTDKNFKPTQKIIINVFDNVEKALEAECALHEFYQVDKNPHFANKAKQTSKKFYYITPIKNMIGENNPAKRPEVREKLSAARKKRVISEETKIKMSEVHRGRPGTYGMLGKKHSEETLEKMRKSREKINSKVWKLKDLNGKIYTITNLKYFCNQNGLSDSAIHRVFSGERNHHKGWTRA